MAWWGWGLIILAMLFALPILIYVCIKLGWTAYYRARDEYDPRRNGRRTNPSERN